MVIYYPIAEYLGIYGDKDAPPVPKPALQQYDNYQIYSLICCDYPVERTYLRKSRVFVSLYYIDRPGYFAYASTRDFDNSQPFTFKSDGSATGFIAFQRYSPTKIPINFETIAAKLLIKPHDTYGYKKRISTTVLGTYTDDFLNGSRPPYEWLEQFDLYPNADSFEINPYNYVKLEYSQSGNGFTVPLKATRKYSISQDISEVINPDGGARLDMFALVGGYTSDPRVKPRNYPKVKPKQRGKLTISYYRRNPTEPIPNITSLDWYSYTVDLNKDENIYLPLVDVVFGTLTIDGESAIVSDIKSQLSIEMPGKYKWGDFLTENIDAVIGQWKSIYDSFPMSSPPADDPGIYGKDYFEYDAPVQRVLAANNNHWVNDGSYENSNFIPAHPLFIVKNKRAYEWHVIDQSDGSYGDLMMNSPKLNDVWQALGAGEWAINPDDPTKPRVDNLGWRIERSSQVLGIRVKADGTVDEKLEKTTNRRLHVDGKAKNDVQEYNPNCFGSEGMLVRVLPNKFYKKGFIDGGYSKVRDIPQMLSELHEQANSAMGYQEGTAIEINIDGQVYRYPNQLALLTELFITTKQTVTYSKGAFFSSLVGEQSIKEVIGGLGLRTVDKFLEFTVAGKTAKLYYKGISASQSIRRKLSAVATNVGIAIGNII